MVPFKTAILVIYGVRFIEAAISSFSIVSSTGAISVEVIPSVGSSSAAVSVVVAALLVASAGSSTSFSASLSTASETDVPSEESSGAGVSMFASPSVPVVCGSSTAAVSVDVLPVGASAARA